MTIPKHPDALRLKPQWTAQSIKQAAALLEVDRSVLIALRDAGAAGFRDGRIHLQELGGWWLSQGDEHECLSEPVAFDLTAAFFLWKRRNGLIR
jgi:hypothetical protein